MVTHVYATVNGWITNHPFTCSSTATPYAFEEGTAGEPFCLV